MTKITLTSGSSFGCRSDQTILDAALENKVFLEHSCKDGRCGVCKAQVLSGSVSGGLNAVKLTDEEYSNGYVLTCCTKVNSDVELAVEDLSFLGLSKPQVLPCRIQDMEVLTSDVLKVTLRIPPKVRFQYLAGQYIDVFGGRGVRRSYSIANVKRENSELTLHIRRVEGGQMSHYWFSEAKLNDLLRFEGPLGTFCLRKTSASNLVFLATGTGIAPVKAILEQINTSGETANFKKIYVFWGGRKKEDIYWRPAFNVPYMKFIPVLSREESGADRRYYVQHAAVDEGLDMSKTDVYACGSKAMIDSAKATLFEAGLPKNRFYSDAFLCSK